MPYRDDFGRAINYLRVSVTDRCNLRCVYCMPEEGVEQRSHANILRYEEMELIIRAAAELGISKVRLTGGEPLARLGLAEFVSLLSAVPGVDDLSMTTNATLLARHAQALASAGLQRLNVSLDSLRPDRFTRITRRGRIEDVFAGVAAARAAGLDPIKFNVVVIRGMNDDEVVDLARKTMTAGWDLRFIEVMPVGNGVLADDRWRERVVTAREIREKVETALGELEPAKVRVGGGPARYYQLPGAKGTLGFITPISEHFCYRCNRLRLTADGQLRPCLLSDREIDLRTPLRQGADAAQIKALLLRGIESKPLHHHLDECQGPENRVMSEIGG